MTMIDHARSLPLVANVLFKKTTFGTMVNYHNDYCYVPILKNAHSWGVDLFTKQGFYKDRDVQNKKYIVFLRDPIKRWASGVVEWFLANVEDADSYVMDELMINMIFDAVAIDSHSELQINYLYGLPIEDCTFFDIEQIHFLFKFKHFFLHNLNIDLNIAMFPKLNTTVENKAKINIHTQLKTIMNSRPNLVKKLKLYYLPDYEFMRSITFYEPNIKYGTK